jgi:hypothetical protein
LAWPSIRVTGSITTVLVIVSPHCSGVPQNGIVETAIELGLNDNLSRSPPCCFYDSYYPPSNPNFYNNFSRFSIAANLGSSRFCVISLIDIMIDRSLCPLCLCGSFHPLALEKCILEYILPTKAGRA